HNHRRLRRWLQKVIRLFFANAPGGSARFVCVARYAPGFLHRENLDDFIFAKEDPNQSGHPIRITMFKPPKDGEAIIGCEYDGGLWLTDEFIQVQRKRR